MVANLKKELVRSFVIGSSLPAFFIFFAGVSYMVMIEKSILFSYHQYSMVTPIYFGTMALIAKLISLRLRINLRTSYFIISILSVIRTYTAITIEWDNMYTYERNSKRGYLQYLLVLLGHLFIYNCIMYPLDVYLR